MNRYEVHYHYGHDRDDWRTMSFVATDIESARNLAIKLVPMDYNIGRVYEKEPFKFNPMEQSKIQNLTRRAPSMQTGRPSTSSTASLKTGWWERSTR